MTDIRKLIGIIGSFEIISENSNINFEGVIHEDHNRFILSGKIGVSTARTISPVHRYTIIGTVLGVKITLINAYIACSYIGALPECIAVMQVDASEIVIGRHIKNDGAIIKATMEFPEIGDFFTEPSFKQIFGHTKDCPYVLEYAFPKSIVVQDASGTLYISHLAKQSWERTKVEYKTVPLVSFEFSSPVSLDFARKQIAKVRNLFLFFADGYLPMHEIELADVDTPKEYEDVFCDFKIINNNNDNYAVNNEPFFVTSAVTRESFQSIWQEWTELYKNKFIPGLYFEIIRNKSTWINEFLNLVQVIDLYENAYRNANIRKLLKDDKKRFVPINCVIIDAISVVNDGLKIPPNRVDCIAKNINDARNYFTHYNDSLYREPSYPEIFAMSRVLRLILLALVYKHLGLPDDVIQDAKCCRVYTSFERDIKVILQEPVDNIDYNAYFC